MASMKDIAEKLHISRCTVSNILNQTVYAESYRPETVELVRKTAEEMNYIPNYIAKSLKTGSTGTIAIIVPDIANTFFIRVIKEVERLAIAANYNLIICMVEEELEKEKNALTMLQSRMVDGVLISPASYKQSLKGNYSFKTVCFDRTVQNTEIPSVMIDDELVSYNLTRQLIERGSKRFVFLAGSKTNCTVTARLKGMNRAVKDAGIEKENCKTLYGIFDEDTAYQKIKKLIQKGEFDFDGVILSTNYFIYGVLRALRDMNKKVENIGGFEWVAGLEFLNQEILYVEHNESEIAKQSFDALVSLMNNRTVESKYVDVKIKHNREGIVINDFGTKAARGL